MVHIRRSFGRASTSSRDKKRASVGHGRIHYDCLKSSNSMAYIGSIIRVTLYVIGNDWRNDVYLQESHTQFYYTEFSKITMYSLNRHRRQLRQRWLKAAHMRPSHHQILRRRPRLDLPRLLEADAGPLAVELVEA